MRASSPGANPGPRSATVTLTTSSSAAAETSIGVSAGVYLIALSKRLISTCSTRRGSSGTSGRSAGSRTSTRRGPSRFSTRARALPMTSSSGLPVLAHVDAAGLEPGHLQEVVHEAIQAIGLLLDRVRELAPGRGVERGFLLHQGAGGAGDGGQRRPEIVRDRAEERVAEPVRLGPEAGLLGLLDERHALDGEGGLGREGLEEMELLGAWPALRPSAARSRGRPPSRARR